MKNVLGTAVFLLLSLSCLADPARCLLIVNNRCTNMETLPLNSVVATLEASLSGDRFTLVNPKTALGEGAAADSPRAMAQKLDCDFIMTATIQEFVGESIGVPVVANRLKTRISLNLAKAGTGDTVCGIMNGEYSKNYSIERLNEDNSVLFEDLLHSAVAKVSKRFLKKAEAAGIAVPGKTSCKVYFGCNVLGADVQIDGVSHGTLPAEVKVTPGIHRIEVSYPPYYLPFERREAKLFDGQTFAIVLQLTDEGRALKEKDRKLLNEQKDADDTRAERSELFKKQLALADALLERYKDSGATDDYVRKTVADGVSIYWKNSHGQIAITDGKAEKIDFATPKTNTNDPVVVPDTGNALKTLREILDPKGGR